MKAEYTDTEYVVSGTDTFTFPQTVQTSSGASDQALIDAIKVARNLADCAVTLSPSGSNIVAVVTSTLNETEFDDLVSTGNTIDSDAFLTAFAGELGISTSGVVITVTESENGVEITLNAVSSETVPLDLTAVQDLQAMKVFASSSASTIVSDIGGGTTTTEELDLCGSRTCSGRGVYEEGVTDANGCVLDTGVCQCSGEWWSIDCEIACTCENDGVCTNSYCHCEYPHHGKRCQDTKTEDCVTCF